MSHPWYVRALLGDPDRVVANAARMHAAGLVDQVPTPWQLSLAVVRMWHRVVFRSHTIGTSRTPVRPTWRARLLRNRAVRLPFLLASRAVIPFDFTGLRSDPDRLIDHLLGAHHDGNQFVFDLELLAGHGALDQLAARVAAVLDGSDRRAEWLRDLTVHVGYHEALAAAVARARTDRPAMTAAEAIDPDLTLRGLLAWCVRQPASPGFAPLPTTSREALLAARPSQLAALLAAGHPIDPLQLADYRYRGTSLGVPAWVERLTWKYFIKTFVRDGDRVRGWNVRVDQDAPWQPRLRGGAPIVFGHFAVVRDGARTVLDYSQPAPRTWSPLTHLRDPIVALDHGSADRLLGTSHLDIAGRWLATPSYFLLERAPANG